MQDYHDKKTGFRLTIYVSLVACFVSLGCLAPSWLRASYTRNHPLGSEQGTRNLPNAQSRRRKRRSEAVAVMEDPDRSLMASPEPSPSTERPVVCSSGQGANLSGSGLREGSEGSGGSFFVGIAISGGGSRAAAFGIAVLKQLDEMGILDKATVISAVSGGSLAAAYYVLSKAANQSEFEERMDETRLRDLLGSSLTIPILYTDLTMTGVAAGPFTNYNRTDSLGKVLEDRFFTMPDGNRATFADLPESPQLLLNASDEVHGGFPFTFIPEKFEKLCSDLSRVQIGAAVAASAAFPFLLRSVAYEDFCKKDSTTGRSSSAEYINLFDGGSSDNLGTDVLEKTYYAMPPRDGRCLMIVIDAFEPLPDQRELARSADLRHWYEGWLDTTSLYMSTSIMLERRRASQLQAMGFCPRENCNPAANLPKDDFLDRCRDPSRAIANCDVWHVNLASWHEYYESLYKSARPEASTGNYSEFEASVKTIPTNWALTERQLDDLFLAAYLKTHLPANRDRLCRMFEETTGSQCK